MTTEFISGRIPAPVASFIAESQRLTVERCHASGVLQMRVTPQSVPSGLVSGPRVALELRPGVARQLAALLVAQANMLEPDCADAQPSQWPGLIEHASRALAGECIFDSETLAVELQDIATAMRRVAA